MFYEPKNGHGLPHNPFNALITPRPIGWISTRSVDGVDNLAPYSFFNGVSYEPPQVMFASTGHKPDRARGKDSIGNAIDTGVFCVNVVGFAMREAMNASSKPAPRDVDEFDLAGLARTECETIACSRIAEAPASMECKLVRTVDLPGEANIVAFGEVTGIHIKDDCLVDGMFDVTRYQPLGRMGYQDYTRVTELFSLIRPT
ncbi:flavin reductase family protein [Maricaulis maris]|jgi:flavin reductase (DIM6/NTAB) family NADH-FMN oxidoreductase RutF|uniref:flavin reductase family protein n=1 Tax=Maricaulis maris TaxID=74318 RepID=UPI0029261CCB|nr:flavin reductase [Maricaulis maris]